MVAWQWLVVTFIIGFVLGYLWMNWKMFVAWRRTMGYF